ncbi:hypothetical protein B0H14DRAFT_2580823 [Mycena olivaceomarginata]|nr:hypothetical protein B0H14DRAFT_2580823 [Mycena olivaceomarginata]
MVECGMRIEYSLGGLEYRHVVLANLRRLRLNAPMFFFNSITTPALEELWILDVPSPATSGVLRSSSRSSCSTNAATSNPTLTTLFITSLAKRKSAREIFEILTITGGPSDICPNLSHIAAGEIQSNELDSFLDMVQSRRSADPCLIFVRVFYKSRIGRPPAPRMDEMRAEGLDIGIDVKLKPSDRNYIGALRPGTRSS